jgi:hypothetical protein
MIPTNVFDELASFRRLVRQTAELRNSARIVPRARKKPIYVTQRIRRRNTLGLAVLANALRSLLSPIQGVLARCQNAPTTVRTIIGRVERGFSAFAEIPYQDARTRQELSLLLNEFEG